MSLAHCVRQSQPVYVYWATFARSQALSKGEGHTKQELSSLEAEADMPLERLLAQYGYVMPSSTNHAGASASQDPVNAVPSTLRQKRRRAQEQIGSEDRVSKRQTLSITQQIDNSPAGKGSATRHGSLSGKGLLAAQVPTARLASVSEAASDSDTDSGDMRTLMSLAEPAAVSVPVELHANNGPAANRPTALGALTRSPSEELQSGSDFDAAGEGSVDADDDEQTLEEEERLAQAEGTNHNVGSSV